MARTYRNDKHRSYYLKEDKATRRRIRKKMRAREKQALCKGKDPEPDKVRKTWGWGKW